MKDYSTIKTEKWRDNNGKEFEVMGILIEMNGTAKFLTDGNDLYTMMLKMQKDKMKN